MRKLLIIVLVLAAIVAGAAAYFVASTPKTSAGVPHSPRLEENSWFIVFERKRRAGEQDHFRWFCNKCGEKVYETSVEVGDYRADPVGQVYQKFSSDEKLRTCKNCDTVVPVPSK